MAVSVTAAASAAFQMRYFLSDLELSQDVPAVVVNEADVYYAAAAGAVTVKAVIPNHDVKT